MGAYPPRTDARKVRNYLQLQGLIPSKVSDICYCRCPRFCSRWASHPFGRRIDGREFNLHLLQHYEDEWNARLPARGHPTSAERAAILGAVKAARRWPGKYLLARGDPCGCGVRCFLTVKWASRKYWDGGCDLSEGDPRACFEAHSPGRFRKIRQFDELRRWHPSLEPVNWDARYEWVDKLPPAATTARHSDACLTRDIESDMDDDDEEDSPNQHVPSSPAPRPSVRSPAHSPAPSPKRPRLSLARQEAADAARRELEEAHARILAQLEAEQQTEDEEAARLEQERLEREAAEKRAAEQARDRAWLAEYAARVAECQGEDDSSAGLSRLDVLLGEIAERRRRQAGEQVD